MPQIGWSELLIIVVIAILVIGPKDFPIVLKKIGTWIRTGKKEKDTQDHLRNCFFNHKLGTLISNDIFKY